MAWTADFTWERGKPDKGDIVIGAGSAEASNDMISVNIDADKLTKGEALIALENIMAAVHSADWPVN